MQKHCSACGAELGETAKFCHRCGAPVGSGSGGDAGRAPAAPISGAPMHATPPSTQTVLPWAVAAIALLCLLAFIVALNWRRAPVTVEEPTTAASPSGGSGARAVDISQMSPDERADRLFNRVMTYAPSQRDSIMFYSPMAIQAMRALAPLNAHRRYDLGLLGIVSGDGAMARAQADSILSDQPNHLLGLVLGMRAAGLQLDSAARASYTARFQSALGAERAKRLPEYIDHAPDIDAAVREIDGRTSSTPTP